MVVSASDIGARIRVSFSLIRVQKTLVTGKLCCSLFADLRLLGRGSGMLAFNRGYELTRVKHAASNTPNTFNHLSRAEPNGVSIVCCLNCFLLLSVLLTNENNFPEIFSVKLFQAYSG